MSRHRQGRCHIDATHTPVQPSDADAAHLDLVMTQQRRHHRIVAILAAAGAHHTPKRTTAEQASPPGRGHPPHAWALLDPRRREARLGDPCAQLDHRAVDAVLSAWPHGGRGGSGAGSDTERGALPLNEDRADRDDAAEEQPWRRGRGGSARRRRRRWVPPSPSVAAVVDAAAVAVDASEADVEGGGEGGFDHTAVRGGVTRRVPTDGGGDRTRPAGRTATPSTR